MPPKEKAPKGLGRQGFKFLAKETTSDALTPIVAHLTARHLAGPSDPNVLDKVFAKALAAHPNITRPFLHKFVKDFEEIPSDVRSRRMPFLAKNPSETAVLVEEARLALAGLESRPGIQPPPFHRPPEPAPAIDHLEPAPGQYGYLPGQTLTAVGVGFTAQAGANTLEVWLLDPDGWKKMYTLATLDQTRTTLRFTLPSDITPGLWHLRAVVHGHGASGYFPFNVSAPGIQLLSVTPANQQPGSWIIINAKDVRPNYHYKIRFTNLDLADPPDPVTADAGDAKSTPTGPQFEIQVPNDVVTGSNAIQLFAEDEVTPPSNLLAYDIGTPKYRIVFSKMHCVDETNWQGHEWGEDEVGTLWTVVTDSIVFTKKSQIYSFEEDDKPNQNYSTNDAQVLTPDGKTAEVKYSLGMITGMFETDANDLAVAQSWMDITGTVASAVVSAAGGGSLGAAITKGIVEGLKFALKYLVGDDVTVGYDPANPEEHPGPIEKLWVTTPNQHIAAIPATEQPLQTMLVGENVQTSDLMLDFAGDSDHGHYESWYQLKRA